MPATVTANQPVITWEKLPDDFVLDDEPADKANRQLLLPLQRADWHSDCSRWA